MKLTHAKIVMLIAEGYHEHEYWFPFYRFREEGAAVYTAGITKGRILGEGRSGKDGLVAEVTHTVEEVMDVSFDCLYLPGGIYGPLALRDHPPALELVRKAMAADTIVAAICHAQWILVSADVVRGRTLTSPMDMAVDIRNAGGNYVRTEAVRDGNLVTAMGFMYLPEQFRLLMPAMAEKAGGREL